MESVVVAIVGGGQAGLATSRELTKAGLEHVVLERGRVGETWRSRWDSFCLVTPNWTVQLPDGHYAGPEPDGFMPRNEFVAYLERYAAESGAPIRDHVAVRSVESLPGDGFVLRMSAGDIHANAVVVGTGAYQRPYRPAAAQTLPAVLDSLVSTRGLEPAGLDDPEPFTSSPPNSIDLADIGSVIFAAGFGLTIGPGCPGLMPSTLGDSR